MRGAWFFRDGRPAAGVAAPALAATSAASLIAQILAITGATQERPYTALSLIDDLARRALVAIENGTQE